MVAVTSEGGAVLVGTTRRRHGLLHWVGQVVAWLVMLSVGALLLVALVVPRVGGATPYVIETSSMRPSLPPGTMVVVKPAAPQSIAIGDVITYQLRSGDPTVVTHRVVAVGDDGTGGIHWRTRGDANGAADRGWVRPQQVQGTLWYAVPYIGYVTSVFSAQQHGALVVLVALLLAGYALVQLRGAWAGRRADREERRT